MEQDTTACAIGNAGAGTSIRELLKQLLLGVLRDDEVGAELARLAGSLTASPPSVDLDEKAAARVVGTTLVTFKRAKIEPDYCVGTRPRWRDAESVRKKFAARGRTPTTPAKVRKEHEIDVEADLVRVGLRRVGRGGGR